MDFRTLLRPLRIRLQRWRYRCPGVASTTLLLPESTVARDFRAGEYCYVSAGCMIGGRVRLRDYVMLGPRVSFVGDDHCFDVPGIPMIFAGRPELRETLVDSDVWIGLGSIIMTGVHIGRGSIIAAGSVVTKSIPPYEIWGGVPARRIRARFENDADRKIHDQMLDQPPTEGEYASPRG